METERQEEFRRLLIPEMTRQELEDRVVEQIGTIDELKSALMKFALIDDGNTFCRPPNITYCNQEIYPDFDCNTCKWKNENYQPDVEPDWDKIIDGISNYLEIEYKNIYGIPKEEFFHFIVSYMEENHPEYFTKKKLDWEDLDKRAMKHYEFKSVIQWRATYQGQVLEWLKTQPEFN